MNRANLEKLLVILPGALVGYSLLEQLQYNGYVNNDIAFHATYVRYISEALEKGNLGLDTWDQVSFSGTAPLRIYQNFPHFLAALLNLLLGKGHEIQACGILSVLALMLQPLAFWKAARWAGFPRLEAILCAWVSPVLHASLPLGHQIEAYLLTGNGAFTQALGVPLFVLTLGYLIKELVLFNGEKLKWDTCFKTGFLLAATFLLHHLYGYVILLAAGALALFSILRNPQNSPRTLLFLSSSFLTFAILSAYQILSLVADGPLLHRSFLEGSERNNGLGLQGLFERVIKGEILDAGRMPVLSFFAYLGLPLALFKKQSALKALGALGLILIILVSGPKSFGSVLQFIPGLSMAHFDRFLGNLQILLVFFAATSLGALLSFAGILLKRSGFWVKPAGLFLGIACLLSIAYAWNERIRLMDERMGWLVKQHEWNLRFDPSLFTSLGDRTKSGFIYADKHLTLGSVPYSSILISNGLPQLTYASQAVSYMSVAYGLRKDLSNEALYHALNISGYLAGANDPSPPSFLKPIYQSNGVTAFTTPAQGLWDVVKLSQVLITNDEQSWVNLMREWLQSEIPLFRLYPSYVPKEVAKTWPSAVPTQLNPSFNGDATGRVLDSSFLSDGKTSATYQIDSEEAYALLRVGFHPRWQIYVDGNRIAPRWLGPGQIGFPLTRGKHLVKAEFPNDWIRHSLFILSVSLSLGFAIATIITKLGLTRLRLEPQRA